MLRRLSPILTRFGSITLVAYVAWMGWQHLGPRKPEIGPVRKRLADDIVPGIVQEMAGAQKAVRQAALLHFENDPTDYFTERLRAEIEQTGAFDLQDRAVGEKMRGLLNLRHASYASMEDATSRGRSLDAAGVVFGVLHAFNSISGGAKIDVTVTVADSKSGDVIFTKRYEKDISLASLAGPLVQEEVRRAPWVTRGLAWLVIVLLLPVFTISFIRSMVRKESNRSNAFTLAIYTVADAILAFLLVGGALTSLLPVLFFIAAVAAALAYNVKVMGWALKLET